MNIQPIPALADNYMYLLVDEATKKAAVVDPVEPQKIIAALQAAGATLECVLTTHHHSDHAGGNVDLVGLMQGQTITVYGADDRIGALTHKVAHNEKFKIGNLDVTCLHTPCHTSGHICYVVKDSKGEQVVFTGDTMFIGGCGRFFEGTAHEMHEALINRLGKLADETKVYCGHEYTTANLKFAAHVEPKNHDIQEKLKWSQSVSCTVPSTIGDEKKFNPFMRVRERMVQQHAKANDPFKVMQFLRDEKNNFKA